MLLLLLRDSVPTNFASTQNFKLLLARLARCWLALPRRWLALSRVWLALPRVWLALPRLWLAFAKTVATLLVRVELALPQNTRFASLLARFASFLAAALCRLDVASLLKRVASLCVFSVCSFCLCIATAFVVAPPPPTSYHAVRGVMGICNPLL